MSISFGSRMDLNTIQPVNHLIKAFTELQERESKLLQSINADVGFENGRRGKVKLSF
jgi:hypothetical protein